MKILVGFLKKLCSCRGSTYVCTCNVYKYREWLWIVLFYFLLPKAKVVTDFFSFYFKCTRCSYFLVHIHIFWTTKTGFLLFLTTVLLLYAMAITRKRRKRVIRNNTQKKTWDRFMYFKKEKLCCIVFEERSFMYL